jgi:hypothetical protein
MISGVNQTQASLVRACLGQKPSHRAHEFALSERPLCGDQHVYFAISSSLFPAGRSSLLGCSRIGIVRD